MANSLRRRSTSVSWKLLKSFNTSVSDVGPTSVTSVECKPLISLRRRSYVGLRRCPPHTPYRWRAPLGRRDIVTKGVGVVFGYRESGSEILAWQVGRWRLDGRGD